MTTVAELQIQDITSHVAAMPEGRSFLKAQGASLAPAFASRVESVILLAEWPLIDGEEKTALRCYAAILPHGQVHIAETFFCRAQDPLSPGGNYMGSARVFSFKYPNSSYDPNLDDDIADILAQTLHLQVNG